MKDIALFGFDGTLYKRDSFFDICKFIFSKRPFRIIFVIFQLVGLLFFEPRLIKARQVKEIFLLYLFLLPSEKLNKLSGDFWSALNPVNFNKEVEIKFREVVKNGIEPVCISATPDIFLNEVSEQS